MRIKKFATTLVLTAAGMSVLGAGTALAAEYRNEVWATGLTHEQCQQRLDTAINHDHRVHGGGCFDWDKDGKWNLEVMVKA
ncbi:hypothetical protein [Saccharopolyspora cebuensis]|uniref:Uncharacterized protein n=1 Tax=Saccharopolyspora cebuensis TaxID=418759 RepID=A0ABV4CQ71_9PSEU